MREAPTGFEPAIFCSKDRWLKPLANSALYSSKLSADQGGLAFREILHQQTAVVASVGLEPTAH
jgi:hypothetical protein